MTDLKLRRQERLARAKIGQYHVAPSILSADFARLGEEIRSIDSAGADWVHVDVMDGHFVPNLTIGAPVVASLAKVSPLPLDCHLMIEKPEKYIGDFLKAGADIITLHIESISDPAVSLREIREGGAWAGLTLKPETDISKLTPYLEHCDLVLVMTVNPGFSGQSFMEEQAKKVSELARIRQERGLSYLIEVDGGINAETKKRVPKADVFVAGNFVFKAADFGAAIRSLKKRDG